MLISLDSQRTYDATFKIFYDIQKHSEFRTIYGKSWKCVYEVFEFWKFKKNKHKSILFNAWF